jgi:hypothetical protein
MKTTALSLALLVLAAATTLAQVPRTINYQGRVSDGPTPINGARTMTLRIYDAATGGVALFGETQEVTFKDGIFTAAIGGGTPGGITPNVAFDKPLWLGVAITGFNGGNEIAPRYILRSSPYSFRAITADSAVSALRAAQAAQAANAAQAAHATSADSSGKAHLADSATNVIAPLTLRGNKTGDLLTVINTNTKGSGIYAQGSPYAITSNGVDSSGKYFVAGESSGTNPKNAPAAGGYYRDNAPIAWAAITRGGTIVSDFGVATVAIQQDSSYLITFDNPLQSATITDISVPEFSPVITIGGLPGQIDAAPVYSYWVYHRNPTGDYDSKSLYVKMGTILGPGQTTPTTRPFTITVFGRP